MSDDFRVDLGKTFHHHLQATESHFERRGSSPVRGSSSSLTRDGLEDYPARQKKNLEKNLRNLDATVVEDERRKTGF